MIDFIALETPAGLQIVRDIAADIWPKTFSPILSPEQIAYMMQMMYAPEVMERELEQGYRFFALRSDGRPAGYFSWSAYRPPETAKLHKVYLLQEFHGRGLGSRMIGEAEKQAAEAGFTKLRLNVNKYNERAKKAYLRNGFAVVESVKIDIGGGFFMDDFVMEKILS